MAAQNDVGQLRRRLDTLVRAASRIRQHAPDLYSLGWDPHVGEALEGDAPGFESRPPRAGDPRARTLFNAIEVKVSSMEADLVGLDRMMMALFTARSEHPGRSPGSTISVAEMDRKIAEQARRRVRGEHVEARIEPQPSHPGRRP